MACVARRRRATAIATTAVCGIDEVDGRCIRACVVGAIHGLRVEVIEVCILEFRGVLLRNRVNHL